jgi:hypothetical protein
VAILSVFAFSVLFGFVLIPVMQGRAAGIDAFDAICRAGNVIAMHFEFPRAFGQRALQLGLGGRLGRRLAMW